MKHDIADPVTIASVLVRDHLDTVIQRHGSQKDDAVSAAVLKITSALLEHLPGEVKQVRVEEGRTTKDDTRRERHALTDRREDSRPQPKGSE